MLRRNFILVLSASLAATARAGDVKPSWPKDYERDLTKWQEVRPDNALVKDEPIELKPPFPELTWQVRCEKGRVIAQATVNDQVDPASLPPFKPRWRGTEMSTDMWNALPVDDGWIIAFDIGEFGAGVVWYNKSGSETYEIAEEYIQTFLVTPEGIFGQGGCAHMGMSSGALSRLDKKGGKWELTHLLDTPAHAPIQWLGGHSLVIVQEGKPLLVFLGRYAQRDWGRFFVAGRVRADDTKLYARGKYAFNDSKLYTGGRGYVTEFDLDSQKVRFLIPDSRFLNDDLRRAISDDAAH